MDPVGAYLLQLLPQYGPWVLFALALLETCFVTGLVVPAGMATSFGTALALEGLVAPAPMIGAAAAGGAVGDTLGYWIGRIGGRRFLRAENRLSRFARGHHVRWAGFFGQHPVYSVTGGRLVAFARTLMPMAAGMSGLSYRTFLLYQIPGLLAWLLLYVGIGMVAGESWQAAVRWVGVGGAAVFLAAGLVLWFGVRARRRNARRRQRVRP